MAKMDTKKEVVNENVYIQTMPNHYVGARIAITIHVREQDAGWVTIKSLQERISLDIEHLNTIGGRVVNGINEKIDS